VFYVYAGVDDLNAAPLPGRLVLRQLIGACKQQPWADTTLYADYSSSNAAAFNSWQTSHSLTQQAIPSPDARNLRGYDVFPETADGKAAAAYSQFYSDLTADTINQMIHLVKQETQGKLLSGIFYAYLMQSSGSLRQSPPRLS
jgi:hypothetical protein